MAVSLLSARPVWAEINLDHIAANIAAVQSKIGLSTRIMAVVKADAYGHGVSQVARTALKSGATSLAVAFVEEGVILRRAGLDAPVLVLGYSGPERFSALIDYKLTPTVFAYEDARRFSDLASAQGAVLPVHLKIDSGMGRLGMLPEEALEVIQRISCLSGIRVEGLYTHLAAAEEEDQVYTASQLSLFNRIIDRCREKGIVIPTVHAANSAAAIISAPSRYNMVRLGLALYGHYPGPALKSAGVELRPALTLKSRVVMVKSLPAGSAISYGCTYRTPRESLIATVSVGYADGYSRSLSGRGRVLIRGYEAPVVGTVCMDHMMVDVSAIPATRCGDEVVIYGRQGGREASVEDAAALAGTLNYELLCAVSSRVPRFYFRGGKLRSVEDYLDYPLHC